MSEKKERFLNGAIAVFAALSFMLMAYDTVVVSGQQGGFNATLKKELRSFTVGEQRNFLLDITGADTSRLSIAVMPWSQIDGLSTRGIEVQEFDVIDENTVDVRVRTTSELDQEITTVTLLVIDNAGYYSNVDIDVDVHVGMSADVLAATGLIGGSGAPLYSASLSPTDPRYYRRQSLQLFLVSDRKSSVKTEAIDKVVKKFRTRLESSNWTFDGEASKTDLVSLIADERTRVEFQELLSKDAETKNSIQLFARKDGSELILMFVRDPIDGSWRALVAQNPAP